MMNSSLPMIFKVSLHSALLFATILTANSLHLAPDNSIPSSTLDMNSNEVQVQVQVHIHPKESKVDDLGMKLLPAGSSLPDCKHACGACNPCKRVMVSFECSIAESCPIVYRCICKGKFYYAPSN